MEVAGLTIGAVALAGLFSTCVECFEYFTAAKSFELDFQVLMVKLDIEKARLLTWGNDAGLLRSESEGRLADLADAEKARLVTRCLESITSLLSNASKLEEVYGLQKVSESGAAGGDLVSANSMGVFRASYKRFWVRFAKDKQRASALSRTKWAVHDKSKFGKFIQDLKDLVDGLNEILPARREKRDQVIQDDISSILDISSLKLVESACDGSYVNWSAAASTIIEESQIGTIDRRNIEEWMMDTAGFADSRGSEAPTIRDQDSTVFGSMPRITLQDIPGLWFLCTPECPVGAENNQMKLCCSKDFGVRVFDQEQSLGLEVNSKSSFSLSQKLIRSVLFKQKVGFTGEGLQIYCSLCVPQIHTALGIVEGLAQNATRAVLRLDDRLPSSCCNHASAYEAISAILKLMEVFFLNASVRAIDGYCWDRTWIEQRQYQLESCATQGRSHPERCPHEMGPLEAMNSIISDHVKGSVSSSGEPFVIMGEPEFVHRVLQGFRLPSLARAPRERELYEITRTSRDKNSWSSNYLGGYVPKTSTPSPQLPVSGGDFLSQNRGSTSAGTSSRARPLPPDFEERGAKRTKVADALSTVAGHSSSQTIQISDE